jgi:GTP-binding protein LepA
MNLSNIRNFSIIAHIDHGKSTMADRLLEYTNTIEKRDFRDQVLDSMDLERERGITIKAHPVTMKYTADDGNTYILNLIDTPGHVDFTYEVSRSLSACEGAILIVDASQGVEAQTVANVHLALQHDLKVIPVINKIDLANANIEDSVRQIEDVLGLDTNCIIKASAKQGIGTKEILESIVKNVPPPEGDPNAPLQALVFDSVYDVFRGVRVYIRVKNGEIKPNTQIITMSTGNKYEVSEVGIFTPKATPIDKLEAGRVGYIVANIKVATEVNIGDTVTTVRNPASTALPGFKEVRPMVFNSIYPINAADYPLLKDALERLRLNDASFIFEADSSAALGFGFRCGFLGLLHAEIIQERLEREFNIGIISTAPSVSYHIMQQNGDIVQIDNPLHFPSPSEIVSIDEPFVRVFVICPSDDIGALMQLAQDRRGSCTKTESIDMKRVILTFELPLNEVVIDFHDRIKSLTRGYGSMDYEYIGFRPSDIVKLDIMLNAEVVDAFSCLVHKDKAESKGREICLKLKELIPRHMFQIPVQAAVGSKIIARETIKAMHKDVTAKCYGGDITRKRKLWEKQKEGKKKMKQIGKVNIPQKVFMDVLK